MDGIQPLKGIPLKDIQSKEEKQLQELERRRRAARYADEEEKEAQAQELQELKSRIEKNIPEARGLVGKIFFYTIAVLADITDFMLILLGLISLLIPLLGEALAGAFEILGDIIDIGVAIVILFIYILLPTARKIFQGIDRKALYIIAIGAAWQTAAIFAGTIIEIIPVIEAAPSWVLTVWVINGIHNKTRERVKKLYGAQLKQIQKLEKELSEE